MARGGIPVILPNRGSPLETPASLRIDLHYAHLQVIPRWTWDRFIRMATFLNYTPAELASVVGLRHSHLNTAQKNNRFHGSTALLLTLMEHQTMRHIISDTIANPFPK